MDHDRLNIVVEANIPFIKGLLEPYANVAYLAPEDITPEAVRQAHALIVRTRTRCDQALLQGSSVSFVATATIGTDHIDLPWCAAAGITVANAAGCNAPAVAQYVLASVLALSNRPLHQYSIGIVGVGHVGRIVERWARQLDMPVLLNDPPRQAAEGGQQWSELAEIAERADIITFHTPLDDTTRHMIDRPWLASLKRAPILINAARGPVADTAALVWAKDHALVQHLVIDCWEPEPDISRELLERADIATPHIAGYSYEGKARAVRMVLDSLCAHFGLPYIDMGVEVPGGACECVSARSISDSYDPLADTAMLKAHPERFEALRNHYDLRAEVR